MTPIKILVQILALAVVFVCVAGASASRADTAGAWDTAAVEPDPELSEEGLAQNADEDGEGIECDESSSSDDGVAEISEADRATMALDSTASQWSFQFAYQVSPDYHDDELDDGSTRPAGNTDFLQVRVVAPLTFKSFTILPRVTLRHYENAQGESGIGNTEIFGLIIPKSWDSRKWYVPIGVRVGKVFVGPKSSWNVYGEYRTSLAYSSWQGSAVKTPTAST